MEEADLNWLESALEGVTNCRVAVYCERGRVLYEEFGKWEIVSPEGVSGGRIGSMEEWHITPLLPIQKQILGHLGLPVSLYSRLAENLT